MLVSLSLHLEHKRSDDEMAASLHLSRVAEMVLPGKGKCAETNRRALKRVRASLHLDNGPPTPWRPVHERQQFSCVTDATTSDPCRNEMLGALRCLATFKMFLHH